MDYHHLLEAAGTVVSGVLLYSLAYVWFAPEDPRRRPLWIGVMGLTWGGLAVTVARPTGEVGFVGRCAWRDVRECRRDAQR